MKAYLNLFVLLLISSCSAVNKNAKFLQQHRLEKTTTVATQQLATESLTLFTDTSYNEVEIELMPNGKFNYSLDKGFEGEASKVKIKQKATSLHTGQSVSKLQQQSSVLHQQDKSDQIQVKEKQIKRLRINWWSWGLVFSILLLTWMYRKRIKNWIG